MKGSYLGELQEIVLLAILSLDDEAYGVAIQKSLKEVANRKLTRGALHSALSRLEEKGYLKSHFGESTAERGGRRKRIYTVTGAGKQALQEAEHVRQQFTQAIKPSFQYG